MTIKAKDPVREAFADCSSGSGWTTYYPSKGYAVSAFDNALQVYDYHLDRDDLIDFHGDEGRKFVDVHNESDEIVGRAVISWYRMASGNYEFTGYLA